MRRLLIAVLIAATAALATSVTTAHADPSEVTSFSVTSTSQVAGAHPDLTINLGLATAPYPADDGPTVPGLEVYPTALLQSVSIALPPEILGDPAAFPTCPEVTVEDTPSACPAQSQVGVLDYQSAAPYASTGYPNYTAAATQTNLAPVFLETPQPGQVALLGIPVASGSAVIHVAITVRDTSDYGLTGTVTGIPSAQPIVSTALTLWGVPGAASHDTERALCYSPSTSSFGPSPSSPNLCASSPGTGAQTFIVNPTSGCTGPTSATATVGFYDQPGLETATTAIPPFTGCGASSFSPSLSLTPDSDAVGQPAGYTATLTVPQPADDDSDAADTTPNVQNVSVTLPSGVSLSPGVADGLSACSDAQFAQGSDAAVACPLSSEIGTVSVVSPLLSAPLTGDVYVGAQESADPTSGDMYRILLNAVGQGVNLKLVGNVAANPSTGQLTATFAQNPQVPFSSLQLSFKGGPRAPLANPQTCGTATSNWSISSYADPASPVTGSSSFPVTGDCALASQFTPSLSAGSVSDRAGAVTPFSFTLTRPDGQQVISGIPSVSLPLGMSATLAGVTQCTSAQAQAFACPASSQVGVATVQSGTGPDPFAVTGQPVYLTGPYEGAPFGLDEAITAVAGPFDLGQVSVRQSLSVNPTTAQVTIHSDPLPTMLSGVPLDLQSISLNIDRPGFMRSPTSCAPQSVRADVEGSTPGQPSQVGAGDAGYATSVQTTAHLTQPYVVSDCGALAFSPHIVIRLTGADRTRSGDHPTLRATVIEPRGQANLRSAQVALPLSLALDPNNSEHVCSVADAKRLHCPARTAVGTVKAITPILPHPLYATVYLVQGVRYTSSHHAIKTLPTLLVPLRGADHVAINLTARTSVNRREQLVTTFGSIPDAAISRFVLTIHGGRRGILVITGAHRSICHAAQVGAFVERGQNGGTHDGAVTLATPACAAGGRSTHD